MTALRGTCVTCKRPFRRTGSITNAQKDPRKDHPKNFILLGNMRRSSATSTFGVDSFLKERGSVSYASGISYSQIISLFITRTPRVFSFAKS